MSNDESSDILPKIPLLNYYFAFHVKNAENENAKYEILYKLFM